jgi:hypothetical protein
LPSTYISLDLQLQVNAHIHQYKDKTIKPSDQPQRLNLDAKKYVAAMCNSSSKAEMRPIQQIQKMFLLGWLRGGHYRFAWCMPGKNSYFNACKRIGGVLKRFMEPFKSLFSRTVPDVRPATLW